MIHAARAQIDGEFFHSEALRTPPLLHVLRLGKRLPDQFARRIEHARDHEVGARRKFGGVARGHHGFFAPAMIIQPTPNLSATMPKLLAKNVSTRGCCTVPPCASASNMRLP